MKNRLTVVAVAGVATLALSGCAGGGSASVAASDPAGAFSAYVDALNAGDYAAALSLVASAGDVDASNVVALGETDIGAPEQVGADLATDATSGTIAFAVDGREGFVGFSQVDGAWKLDAPVFLAPVLGYSSSNAIVYDREYLGVDVTLPDGVPLADGQWVVVSEEATYAFPAEYSGGTRFEPIAYEYEVTYAPVDGSFAEVDVDATASDELYAPVFTDAYSDEVIAGLPDLVVYEGTTVAGDGVASDVTYEATVDAITESSLNDCEWYGGKGVGKTAAVICTPTQFTVTFATAWPGFPDRYEPGSIGAAAHAAGESFTYTEVPELAALSLRLVDETNPADDGDESRSAFEYIGDMGELPMP
ncbi:hypothetical protein [Microbacterium aurantiacum]|uniref:hypothetical protein n=1 Tax=Microbacterium aurantiacum TaxID=162393 RepID=UPI003F49692B